MDIIVMLERRLAFIEQFYDRAAESFETIRQESDDPKFEIEWGMLMTACVFLDNAL